MCRYKLISLLSLTTVFELTGRYIAFCCHFWQTWWIWWCQTGRSCCNSKRLYVVSEGKANLSPSWTCWFWI